MDVEKRELFEMHLSLVLEANQVTNLTRITSWEEGCLLHIEDSLVGVPEVNEAPDGLLADLGSGAGYPGIPLAVETGRKTTLVESIAKKATLLEQFVDRLELGNSISVYSGRAEELARERPQEFSVVTARALSSLPSLMELASPLLKQGGRLICYKSTHVDDELDIAKELQQKLAMLLIEDREAILSDGKTPRRILVFEKQGEPQVTLPRKIGKAQKSPYRK